VKTGRPKVHLERQLEKGRLSNKRKEERAPRPVKIGGPMIRMPPEVKADYVAKAKWLELKRLFAGKDFVSSSDVGVISRYCLLCSEEAVLREKLGGLGNGELKDLLAVNKAIDAKRGLIRSLEDRLYLNPQAKMRGLPPEPKDKMTPERAALETAGFGEM
jgi:phage terminase small subunit